MNTNKQTRETRSEFTANGMMVTAATRSVAAQQNGWTVGKNFFKPVAKKQPAKNKSFLQRFF